MSSIHAAKSQIAPHKYFATDVGASGLIYDDAGSNGVTVAANTTLRDMGKTIYLTSGAILRKVQVLPVTDSAGAGRTGYIYLNAVPAGQNIVSIF